MSLEKWVEYGWLRRELTSPSEIKDLWGIVDRSLAELYRLLLGSSLPLTQLTVLQPQRSGPQVIARSLRPVIT
jgi:hypothetical protein